MLTKYLLIAIAALTLALGGAGWLLKRSYSANGALAAQRDMLAERARIVSKAAERNRVLSQQAARDRAVRAREQAAASQRLDTALTRSRAWADQPVPKEVQDALAKP